MRFWFIIIITYVKTNLSFIFTRGVDPNDPGPKAKSPLMLAAKHGRDENIKVLLGIDNQGEEDMDDDSEEHVQRVTVNAKNKHSKAAIHYAAKGGHAVSSCRDCSLCIWVQYHFF